MTRYEEVRDLWVQTQAMAYQACGRELELVGAGPVTLTYGDNLQDAADALELVMLALTPVPASGIDIDGHHISLERDLNRLCRFETIGDEQVLVFAEQAHADAV